MLNMQELSVAVDQIFDPAAPDALENLIQAAMDRTQAMRTAFEERIGGSSNADAQRIRERLATISQGLGEVIGHAATLQDDKASLFASWGISSTNTGGHDVAPSVVEPGPASRPSPTLELLYRHHPWLRPGFAQEVAKHNAYAEQVIASGEVRAALHSATIALQQQRRRAGLLAGINYAAASLLSSESKKSQRDLQRKTPPSLREAVSRHLLKSLTLLSLNAGKPLPAGILAESGTQPDELPDHLKAPELPDPSLGVLILAADVVSASEVSVLSLDPRLMPSLSAQEINREVGRMPSHRPPQGEARQLQRSARDNYRTEQIARVGVVRQKLREHLEGHYGVWIKDDQMLGFLAECRIAERLQGTQAGTNAHQAVVARLDRAMARLRPEQIPEATRLYASALKIL